MTEEQQEARVRLMKKREIRARLSALGYDLTLHNERVEGENRNLVSVDLDELLGLVRLAAKES